MLYTKKHRLDPGNNTEFRILKMEEQRLNTLTLLANLSKYAYTLEQLSNIETKIAEDLLKLYTNDSIYSDLAHNLQKALQYKSDIVKRETKSLKDIIDKNKSLENTYKPLKPLVKHYFKSIDKNEHYTKKLPKVIDYLEGRKKIKGELSKRETEKMVRNKRKLENAQTDLKVVNESIVTESNKINLDKFNSLNRIIKEFINTELSTTYLMTEKLSVLDQFEAMLETKEDEQFNEKYFLDIKKESKSQFNKSVVTKKVASEEVNEPQFYKQNIQNNHYYLYTDDRSNIDRFGGSNDIIPGHSQFNNKSGYKNDKSMTNKSNMIEGERREFNAIEDDRNNNGALALMNN